MILKIIFSLALCALALGSDAHNNHVENYNHNNHRGAYPYYNGYPFYHAGYPYYKGVSGYPYHYAGNYPAYFPYYAPVVQQKHDQYAPPAYTPPVAAPKVTPYKAKEQKPEPYDVKYMFHGKFDGK